MMRNTFFFVIAISVVLGLSYNAQADNPIVVLGTNYGNISVELFEAEAPITVANFLGYVNSGFYDGLIFHRVINSFMIQGGAYDLSLTVRPPGPNIINESYNGLINTRGTIAMARADDSNSANSQFYINDVDNPGLDYNTPSDPRYCVFGEVLSQADLDVVNAISEVPVSNYSPALEDLPYAPVVIFSAYQKTDLVINDLGPSQIAAYVNESIGVTIETGNIGDFNAVPGDPNFDVTLYLSDDPNVDWDTLGDGNEVGEYSLSSLVAGANYSELIDFNTPGVPGTYYLRAKTDDFNSIVENNETNNWGPVIVLEVFEADYYVSTEDGNDLWDGKWHIYQSGTTGPKATIQAGIDAASDGNTVMIADGIYKGDGNRDLDFNNMAITVCSLNGAESCIIDCNGTDTEPHRGFWFGSGEDANSIIDGLTIKNGYTDNGGGIYCEPNSTPTIMNCIIRKCQAESDGGGIYGCDGIINNCTVRDCFSIYDGGGLSECNGQISNCNIFGNRADFDGAGLAYCNGTISDCNIVPKF